MAPARHFFKCPRCGYEAPPTQYEYSGHLKARLPEILQLLHEGKSPAEVSDALGLYDPQLVNYIRRRYGLGPKHLVNPFQARNEEMAAEHSAGAGYAAIARKHGITGHRVHQIIERIETLKAEKAKRDRARQEAARLEDIPLFALDLPGRIGRGLAWLGCSTVGDAMKLDAATLLTMGNFGRGSLQMWQRHLLELQREFEARR